MEQMQRALRMEKKVREERLRMLKDRLSSPEHLITTGGVPQLRFLARSAETKRGLHLGTHYPERNNMSLEDRVLEDMPVEADEEENEKSDFLTEQRMNDTGKMNNTLRVTDQGFRVKMILGRKLIKGNRKKKRVVRKYKQFKNLDRNRTLKSFSSYQKNYKNILKKIKENEFKLRLPNHVRPLNQNFNEFYYVSDEELVFPLRDWRKIKQKGPSIMKQQALDRIKKKQLDRINKIKQDMENKRIVRFELEKKKKQLLYQKLRRAKKDRFKVKSATLPKANWAKLYDGPQEFQAYLMDMPYEYCLDDLKEDVEVRDIF